MVVSSSVVSRNSADRVFVKRKFCDIDESDCRSNDVDTESLDTKKMNHVRVAKRGRAAKVHNLSERVSEGFRGEEVGPKFHVITLMDMLYDHTFSCTYPCTYAGSAGWV
ncbi:hypothetical protein ACS0TY_026494 [Phlomoides rotata]